MTCYNASMLPGYTENLAGLSGGSQIKLPRDVFAAMSTKLRFNYHDEVAVAERSSAVRPRTSTAWIRLWSAAIPPTTPTGRP